MSAVGLLSNLMMSTSNWYNDFCCGCRSLLSVESEDFPTEPLECVLQGCLRRKTVQKSGRKPAVAAWQRYWVQVRGSSMVYFPAKGFKGSERADFKREPCKVLALTGLRVALIQSGSPPDLFQLSDPVRGKYPFLIDYIR